MSALVGLRTFEKHFESDGDRAFFARCITGCAYRTPRPGVLARNAVISLLNSTTIDVDKLDYLIRDAFVTGFRNAAIDYERLLSGISFHRFSKDDDRFELAYEKSAVSVLENVVYARDSERKWIQNHPLILYEGMLVSHMMESVAERFFNSSAELFCADALSNEGMVLNGRRVRLLSDNDILCYAKQIEDDPCIDWYFNRGSRHKPFWKSEAEFKAVFRSRLGTQYEKLFNNFKSLEKHLLEVTGRPVINAGAVTAMKKYVAQIQEETQKAEDSVKKEFQSNLRQYQRSLKIMNMLDDFVSSLPESVRLSFTVLSAPDFNSGFAPGKLETTKIHIPQQDQLSILSDIVSLPRVDKSDGSFFYLYSDEKDKIDTAALEEMLLQYAFGL